MINIEEKRYQSIFPMIREYLIDYLKVHDISVYAMKGILGIGGGSVLPSIVHGKTPTIHTIELLMEFFDLSYTDLESWYNERHGK